ncbi:N-acetyltransferase [Photobacterium sanctipauli]|uniref:N-acetyltransferase n=1 Tax=Photobacterium sanctipauli TaxID=1342794 RepID=A0A2T3NN34_9GAMM|nr:N-acetyltransferase [Photobacterium sanctipauli]PSW16873.1 N-acetyltransferase [Photobacterium sanctipauli]
MKIRLETASDSTYIESLTYQAFENHPHHEPGAKPTEHLIVNRLREGGALSLSLVAEDESGIIGHIAFSPVTIAGEASKWFGLGPVSVTPSRQGEGIGGSLIREGVEMLKTQGAEGIVLLGEPEYYGRFGFKANDNLTLPGVPAEYFLVMPLCENSCDDAKQSIPTGDVAYHPAFG